MRISQRFTLGRTQHELDFVDIDLDTDFPLFLDPYFLSIRDDRWSIRAHRTLTNFFDTVIRLVRSGEEDRARRLFINLHEPNETCLGFSTDEPRGRGIGRQQADDLFDAILQSQAIETGLVENLEDLKIFVDGIGRDKISDMTTNIIRRHLIEYTQSQCELWEIPLQPGTPSGPYWSPENRRWRREHTDMLVVDGRRILLVPKSIVTYSDHYSGYQFHQHFVLNFLRDEHLRRNSPLVRERESGERYVTKQDLKDTEAPLSKEFLRRFTQDHPEVFVNFREQIENKYEPLSREDLSSAASQALNREEYEEYRRQLQPEEVAQYLLEELRDLPTGRNQAENYHDLAAAILEFILHPTLTCPTVEEEIHQGRKRIDIVFDNAAQGGFFRQLQDTWDMPCQFIFVECKNYSADPNNPELDQLAGRFSPNRGKFGLMLVRDVDDMDRLLQRCADTYEDERGMIIPLEDEDIEGTLETIIEVLENPIEEILTERRRRVALR